MAQKTVTVEHPDAHTAQPGALEAAAAKAGIPEDYEVQSYVNVSGDSTRYVLVYDDQEQQLKAGEKDLTPAEPVKSKVR
jgi:hypothetical protein